MDPSNSSDTLNDVQVDYDADRDEVQSVDSSHYSAFTRSRLSLENAGSFTDVAIQRATKGYPSKVIGQSRAQTMNLPPTPRPSRRRDRSESGSRSGSRRRAHRHHRDGRPYAKKATRSLSEKVVRNSAVVVARSRSSPVPASRQRQKRKGFWGQFGVWARIMMSKFRNWTTSVPSYTSSIEEEDEHDLR